jgi:hypothetical protein
VRYLKPRDANPKAFLCRRRKRIVRRSPLSNMLRAPPTQFGMILGGVGNCVHGLGAGLLPRQQRHSAGKMPLHPGVGAVPAFRFIPPVPPITDCAHRPRHFPKWAADPVHRRASIPSQSTARWIAWKSSDLLSRPSMCTVQSSPGRSSTQTSYTLLRACTRYVAAYLLEVCAMILHVMTAPSAVIPVKRASSSARPAPQSPAFSDPQRRCYPR